MEDINIESSSSSSDSSSEMEEDINEEEVREEVKLYKQKISGNEIDYDSHVCLIKSLKKLGELEELRDARNHFSRLYPLTQDLWMEWLNDEQRICTTDVERAQIAELFERAVKDYISVKIWVEYILFMLKGGDQKSTRQVCEKALNAVGIHFSEGILAWQAVMLVEQQVFGNLKSKGDADIIKEQKTRIQNLYRRQARIPLLNSSTEEFLTETTDWFDGKVDSIMENDLKNSSQLSSRLYPFEDALELANSEVEKLEAYRKYLDYVRKNSNPAFIQITYERAVVDLCLHSGIWEEYVKFAMEQFSSAGYVILPICERSQRNCPWSSVLCSLRMRAMQKYIQDKKQIKTLVKECHEKSIASGIQDKDELNRLWMSYLVFLRMQINWEEEHENSLQEFRDACYQATDFICEAGDVDCEIVRYLARVETQFVGQFENVRSIYNEKILRCGHNFNRADLWLEFIALERSYGDTKHARKLFRRALERVWDDVELIAKEFLKFEHEIGTLETIDDFERKYKDRLAVVQKRRLEESAKQTSTKYLTKKTEGRKENKGYAAKIKPEKTVITEIRKKIKPKSPPHIKEHSTANKRQAEESEFRSPKKPKVDTSHGENIKHDSSNDYRSVFLSNLSYSAEEEHILPLFSNCGEVETFRLVKDFKGRSKGFGYLVFKQATSVKEALKLDRTPLENRPVFVSNCGVSRNSNTFQYSTGLEKEKLFVRGLPVSMKEDEIKQLFSTLAKVKYMRLITHRNGYSKGCCYIEYFSAKDAENVRTAMDNTEVNDRRITVLISNPTAKKVPSEDALSAKFSAPGTSQSRGQKERLFLPRAVLTKADKNVKETQNGSEILSVPKTNDEFRKMLLK